MDETDSSRTPTEWAMVRCKVKQMLQSGVPDHVVCSTLRSQGVPTTLVDLFTTQESTTRSWALDNWLQTTSDQDSRRITRPEPQAGTVLVEDTDGVFSFPAPPVQRVPVMTESEASVNRMKLRMQVRALYYRLRTNGVSRDAIFRSYRVARIDPDLYEMLEDFVIPAPTEISSETDPQIQSLEPAYEPPQRKSPPNSSNSGATVCFHPRLSSAIPNTVLSPRKEIPNPARGSSSNSPYVQAQAQQQIVHQSSSSVTSSVRRKVQDDSSITRGSSMDVNAGTSQVRRSSSHSQMTQRSLPQSQPAPQPSAKQSALSTRYNSAIPAHSGSSHQSLTPQSHRANYSSNPVPGVAPHQRISHSIFM